MARTNKNELIVKLKEELDSTIRLVVSAREKLEAEFTKYYSDKMAAMDDKFLRKLKELTSSFNSLTESKIRLDKAEKALERDLTAAEELDAVKNFLIELPNSDFHILLNDVRDGRD